jgi:hypothetical protein
LGATREVSDVVSGDEREREREREKERKREREREKERERVAAERPPPGSILRSLRLM